MERNATFGCPYCGSDNQIERMFPEALSERAFATKSFFSQLVRTFFRTHASCDRDCSDCRKPLNVAVIPTFASSTSADYRPVILLIIPNLTTKYTVSVGHIQIHGMFGALKGSVPLKGADFSVLRGGLFDLGVGDINVRGRNSEELLMKNVFRAKSVREELQRIQGEA